MVAHLTEDQVLSEFESRGGHQVHSAFWTQRGMLSVEPDSFPDLTNDDIGAGWGNQPVYFMGL